MGTPLVLRHPLCLLRPWRPGDEPALVRNADNRRIWANVRDRFPHPYRPENARAFIAIASAQERVTDFAIDVGGEAVGGAGCILGQDIERCSAEIGYWLGEAHWGKGIASAAVETLCAHLFASNEGLTRLFALPFAENAASRRVLEKAGFTLDAVLRRSAIKEGRVQDQALYSRLRRD